MYKNVFDNFSVIIFQKISVYKYYLQNIINSNSLVSIHLCMPKNNFYRFVNNILV